MSKRISIGKANEYCIHNCISTFIDKTRSNHIVEGKCYSNLDDKFYCMKSESKEVACYKNWTDFIQLVKCKKE